MATDKLGVTVMELFTYNPYRIIGVPVNAPQEKIDLVYQELMTMCENDTIASYRSPFDFPSLPPFERNAESLASAYSKLSGDVYRCFAFSESLYAVNLSYADISIQISNIDSYDKFLSCYTWLIINDPHLAYKNLWFKISKHVDMLICSEPENWEELFDRRFPKEVYENDMVTIKGFYTTFCEVILLPLKELVRGSLDCMTASEILSNALFDGDFEAFITELENSEKAIKRAGKKNPEMPSVSQNVVEENSGGNGADEKSGKVNLLENLHEETNIYTDALNQMIKNNRARNQEIKSVDTTKVFGNGNLGKDDNVELLMSSVNQKVYDPRKLASPYDTSIMSNGEMDVDISDMLNPRINYSNKGIAQMRDSFSGGMTAVEPDAKKVKKSLKFIIKLTIFIIIVTACVSLGYVYKDEIISFFSDMMDKYF